MTIFRRPCLHMEGNHVQMKPTVQFRACYKNMRIRDPTSRSKSAQAQDFRQSQKQTQGSEGQMSSITHLTFGEHLHANTGSPQGVHRPKMGPDGLRKGRPTPWVARPLFGLNQAQLSPVVPLCIPYVDPEWYHPES